MIWYDRRCAGLSQYDATPFTLEDLANDAVDLLNHFHIDQAAVIATSAGGPIGLRLALDHPDRVQSLVLLNTGASLMSLTPTGIDHDDPFVADRLETVAKRLALMELMETQGIEVAVAASEDEWRMPPQPPEPEPALATLRNNRIRLLKRLGDSELARLAQGALLNMKAQAGEDLLDELDQINCPLLILHGDADTTLPIEFGRSLSEAMPRAEFIALRGEGHGLIVNPLAQQVSTDWLRSRP